MRKTAFCLLLGFCLLLTGCSSMPYTQIDESKETVTLPTPSEDVPQAPVGDGKDSAIYRASLHYASEDGTQLMPLTRVLWLTGSWDMARQLAEELLQPPSAAGSMPVAADGVALSSIEVTGGIATVDLSLRALDVESDADLLMLSMAMANTLTELDRVDCVNVLYGGRPAYVCGLPLGLMRAGDGNVSAEWARLQAEASRVERGGDTTYALEREAALYYPTDDGMYVTPVTRTVRFSGSDYAAGLVALLQSEPADEALMLPGVPYTGNVLTSSTVESRTRDGLRILELYFADAFLNAIDQSDVERWQFLASITLTITGFCPELDGIRVYIGNRMVEEVPYAAGGGSIAFENGIIRRADFVDMIGDIADLYYVRNDGALAKTARAVGMQSAANPRALIALLMENPDDTSLSSAFPAGASASDIIGTRVSEDILLLNLSANLYRVCQALTAEEEAAFVYAIVSTVTELADIRGVRFYFEGERVGTLAGGISLMGVVLRNPGIVKE